MQLRFRLSSSLVLTNFAFIAACGGGGTSHHSGDMAMPGDMAAPGDMGAQGDMGAPGDMAAPNLTTLSLSAGGLGGAGAADHIGSAARFGSVTGVALDDEGNLYVSDNSNNAGGTIRKLALATGMVTTVAGTADAQADSTDGTGPDARFNNPQAMAYGMTSDGKKNLYIADTYNNTIRVLDPITLAVTTLAGNAVYDPANTSSDGTGPDARFNGPVALASDGTGMLYVVDSGNSTIRAVDVNTRVVTTLAGTAGMLGHLAGDLQDDGTGPAARFFVPTGVAYGKTGGGQDILYVTDGNNTLRQVFINDKSVITLTQNNQIIRFNSTTSGVALYGAGNLYVTLPLDNTIQQVDLATGDVTTLAGIPGVPGSSDGSGGTATFSLPHGLASDSATGNLYVADTSNNTIRKIVIAMGTDRGKVTTPAGAALQTGSKDGTGADARFFAPNGATGDGNGNIYIADTFNFTIRKVNIPSGQVDTVAGTVGEPDSDASHFNYPYGVTYVKTSDGKEHLYVADTFNNMIRDVDPMTGIVTNLAGTAGDPETNRDGTGPDARFNGPQGVVSDDQGNLYVTDTNNGTIRKVVATGANVGVVTTLIDTNSLLDGPQGVTIDEGNLYVTDPFNNRIVKVVIDMKKVSILAGAANGDSGYVDNQGTAARFNYPTGVAGDGAGNLYVADSANHMLRRVVIASGAVSTVAGVAGSVGVWPGPLPAGLNNPLAVAAIPSSDSSPSKMLAVLDENSVLLLQ